MYLWHEEDFVAEGELHAEGVVFVGRSFTLCREVVSDYEYYQKTTQGFNVVYV